MLHEEKELEILAKIFTLGVRTLTAKIRLQKSHYDGPFSPSNPYVVFFKQCLKSSKNVQDYPQTQILHFTLISWLFFLANLLQFSCHWSCFHLHQKSGKSAPNERFHLKFSTEQSQFSYSGSLTSCRPCIVFL